MYDEPMAILFDSNQIHSLEHDLQRSGQPTQDVEALRLQSRQLELERSQLADEYMNVKAHYNSLADELEREVLQYLHSLPL